MWDGPDIPGSGAGAAAAAAYYTDTLLRLRCRRARRCRCSADAVEATPGQLPAHAIRRLFWFGYATLVTSNLGFRRRLAPRVAPQRLDLQLQRRHLLLEHGELRRCSILSPACRRRNSARCPRKIPAQTGLGSTFEARRLGLQPGNQLLLHDPLRLCGGQLALESACWAFRLSPALAPSFSLSGRCSASSVPASSPRLGARPAPRSLSFSPRCSALIFSRSANTGAFRSLWDCRRRATLRGAPGLASPAPGEAPATPIWPCASPRWPVSFHTRPCPASCAALRLRRRLGIASVSCVDRSSFRARSSSSIFWPRMTFAIFSPTAASSALTVHFGLGLLESARAFLSLRTSPSDAWRRPDRQQLVSSFPTRRASSRPSSFLPRAGASASAPRQL